MRLSSSSRLAWAVAFAAVMLCAAAAPAALGGVFGHPIAAQQTVPEDQKMVSCELQNSLTTEQQGNDPSSPSPDATDEHEVTILLCGGPDPEAERAIEQLINGRSFKTKLTSRPDGCADLTITVPQQSQPNLGRQSSSLTVSTQNSTISVQIVTENGVTKATIGAKR